MGTVFTHTPTHILNVLQVYKSATDAAGNQSGPNEPIVDAGLVFALFFIFLFLIFISTVICLYSRQPVDYLENRIGSTKDYSDSAC